jgi:hypothetical protein
VVLAGGPQLHVIARMGLLHGLHYGRRLCLWASAAARVARWAADKSPLAPVAHMQRAALLITSGKGVGPVDGVTSDAGRLLGDQPLGEEPNDVPMAPRHGLFRLTIACRQRSEREVGLNRESFWHAHIIRQELV